jgi:hypothetical protein
MKGGAVVLAALLATAVGPTIAAEPTVAIPKVVADGLAAYASGGPEEAVKAWTKGGPSEGNEAVIAQAGSMKQLESYYGKYVGYQVIGSRELTATSRLLYLQLDYEKGPVFSSFLLFKPAGDWIVTGKIVMNTDPTIVLPEHLR